MFNKNRVLCDIGSLEKAEGVTLNKRKIGSITEEIAAAHLKEQGVHIVEKNFCIHKKVDAL